MASPPERTLDQPLHLIRLHHPRFAPLDGTGAQLHGGRWNSPGAAVVYAALTYGGAILETRVHANTRTPPPREIAVITVPAGVRIAELSADDVKGWDDPGQLPSRTAGNAWIAAARTVALIVPSKAGAPLERIAAINLAHPDAGRLTLESLGPVPWDLRLFAPAAPPAPRARRRQPARKKK